MCDYTAKIVPTNPIMPARNAEAISAELRRKETKEPEVVQAPKTTFSTEIFPTVSDTFKVQGQIYYILRFPEGRSATLAQSIAIARESDGREMLTRADAFQISDDPRVSDPFKKILMPGEWTYIRDQQTESRSRAAYLVHDLVVRRLVVADDRADVAAPVVVLKKVKDFPSGQQVNGSIPNWNFKQPSKVRRTLRLPKSLKRI